MNPSLCLETLRALEGLVESLSGEAFAAEHLLLPLARIGDALRLGLELSQPVRHWMDELSVETLGIALAAQTVEVKSWIVPPNPTSDDPTLAFSLRRRDEAESVRVSALRICLPRWIEPMAVPNLGDLAKALDSFDKTLRSCVTSGLAERLLGTRAVLQTVHGWTSKLPQEPTDECKDERDGWLTPLRLPQGTPSDEVIAQYISEGVLAQYVEKCAENSAVFRADLKDNIQAARDAGVEVGPGALRWEKETT